MLLLLLLFLNAYIDVNNDGIHPNKYYKKNFKITVNFLKPIK